MKEWVISDTHFGHTGIIRHCKRPFKSTVEMDILMIDNWNKVVAKDDLVFHLGDFAWHGTTDDYLPRLNGKKHLIIGNHDDSICLNHDEWSSVAEYRKIYRGEKTVILFHYPIFEWDHFFHGSYHLYGHVHNNVAGQNPQKRSMNCSVEMPFFNYSPRLLDDIITELDKNV